MRINILFFVVVAGMLTGCKPGPKELEEKLTKAIASIAVSKNEEAISELTEIIKYQDDNYQAYFYRANANFNLKKAEEALTDYNKSIEIKPDYADAYYNRGLCKNYLGDKMGACKDWDLAASFGKPNVSDMLNECP